jgi:hypothetical protein
MLALPDSGAWVVKLPGYGWRGGDGNSPQTAPKAMTIPVASMLRQFQTSCLPASSCTLQTHDEGTTRLRSRGAASISGIQMGCTVGYVL